MGQVFFNKHELEVGHIIEDMVYVSPGRDEKISRVVEVTDFIPGGFKGKDASTGEFVTYKFERIKDIKFREGDK